MASPMPILPSSRKTPVRFSATSDLALLKETVATNPYRESGKWGEVVLNLEMEGLTDRRARERISLLLAHFISEDCQNLRRSETQALCQELIDFGHEVPPTKENFRDKENRQKGLNIRKRAMESLSADVSDDKSTPGKKKRDILSYIEEKNEREMKLKQEDLKLRAEEIKLKKEELELEKKRVETQQRQMELQFRLFERLINKDN